MKFFRTVIRLKGGTVGAVMAIQTFDDYGHWHPHLHAIVTDGLFTENGTFYVMPQIDLNPLQELFRVAVLKMLKKEGKVDEDLIEKIMRWRYTSGFGIHNRVRLDRDDADGQEALAQYIIRIPFSVEKIHYRPESGTIIYRSKMSHGRNKSNFKVFKAQEFIAAITQHNPQKSFQLVRYYGWYSNRSRGDRRKATRRCLGEQGKGDNIDAPEVLDVGDYKPRRIPSKTWRECIKKMWEVDPLHCPRCSAEMKIVSFITERPVIRRILEHLVLWPKSMRAARPPPSDHTR